ncbi:MAG: hypothetical protein FJ098_07105 [Deltaproteobacteria bacterium]|nr:hypothetical protein [Deltaproteobacteria bacterium]
MDRTGGRWLLLLLAGVLALAAGCDGGGGGGGEEDTVFAGDTGGRGGEDTPLEPGDDVTCLPACGVNLCGPDGCGGQCGTCSAGLECQGGQCVTPPPDCISLCAGKACGTVETCTCGTCAAGLQCIGYQCQTPLECDHQGFSGVVSQAKIEGHQNGGFYMHFQTLNKETIPFDVIVLELETDVGGPTGPGTYDAAYTNFTSHGLWLYVLTNWNGNGYEKLLVPVQGTINISSLSAAGGQFTATTQGIQLREGVYNPNTQGIDMVAHGATWCLDGVVLDTPITITASECVEEGTGQLLGDNIANFQLQNCNGDWVNLHDGCGDTKALWLVATAGW